MKNVFVNCTPKEFYEVLKPLLLTLEGYKCYNDEWNKNDNGCRIDYDGDWFPYACRGGYQEIDLDDFIAQVKPKPVDLSNRFIPCTEEQVDEVCDLLEKLGYKQWDSYLGVWKKECSQGVFVGDDNEYFCIFHEDQPTLTLEELRELAKTVKL